MRVIYERVFKEALKEANTRINQRNNRATDRYYLKEVINLEKGYIKLVIGDDDENEAVLACEMSYKDNVANEQVNEQCYKKFLFDFFTFGLNG